MRFRHPLAFLSAVGSLACSSYAAEPEAVPAPEPAPVIDGIPEPPSSEDVTVKGRVVLSDGSSAGLREIVVVDAEGEKKTIYSDVEGSFTVEHVHVPYDLLVRPRTPVDMPRVYLGLSETEVEVVASEMEPPRAGMTAADLRLNVAVPPCPTSDCLVHAMSESATAHAGLTTSYSSQTTLTLEWRHTYPTSATQESVAIHVFVVDAIYSRAWHGETTTLLASSGVTTVSAAVSSVSLPSHPVRLDVTTPDATAGWRTTVNTWLTLQGSKHRIPWAYSNQRSFTFAVPNISGATISASANLSEPVEDPSAWLFERRTTTTKVSSLPSSTTQIDLALEEPLTMQAPRAEGELDGASDIAWEGPAGITTLVLHDEEEDRTVVHVTTAGKTVSRVALDALGITIEPGVYSANILTRVGATIADVAPSRGVGPKPSSTGHVFRFVAK